MSTLSLSCVLYEKLDANKLDELIEMERSTERSPLCVLNNNKTNKCKPFRKHPTSEALLKLKPLVKDGYLKTDYKYTNKLQIGRIYAQHGLQTMSRVQRAILASATYHDIDIVNSGPTIIRQIAEKHDMSCKYLADYVINREKWLQQIESNVGVNRDMGKELVVRLLHGGKLSSWLKTCGIVSSGRTSLKEANKEFIGELSKLERECHRIILSIALLKEYEFIVKAIRNKTMRPGSIKYKGKPVTNPLGKICAYIYQYNEAIVLNHMIEYFTKTEKRTVGCLIFDGMLIEKTESEIMNNNTIDKATLQRCTDYIFSTTGFRIKLIVKPMC